MDYSGLSIDEQLRIKCIELALQTADKSCFSIESIVNEAAAYEQYIKQGQSKPQ